MRSGWSNGPASRSGRERGGGPQRVNVILQAEPEVSPMRWRRRFPSGRWPFPLLSDNLTNDDLALPCACSKQRPPPAHPVEVPTCGVRRGGAEGRRVTAVEKPADLPSDLAIAGIYLFTPSVHDAIATSPFGPRAEITDAIALVADGRPVPATSDRVVGGRRSDPLLEANARLRRANPAWTRPLCWRTDIAGSVARPAHGAALSGCGTAGHRRRLPADRQRETARPPAWGGR